MNRAVILEPLSKKETYEICLSPKGILSLIGNGEPSYLASLHQIFCKDWREGVFYLAADKVTLNSFPSIKFWQDIAKEYLTKLCHLPEETEFTPIELPGIERISEWLIKAPPMPGGEYLSFTNLKKIWDELNLWVYSASIKNGGIHCFLEKWASKWQQIGRVCFHLAENKKNPLRPFAFLATYSTGFGANGNLKHLPLKKALEQYSGENNHQALVKLLTPVQRAADKCPWVKDLADTTELYQPLMWSPKKAHTLLSSVPDLEESGLSVRVPNWWKRRSRPQVSVTIGSNTHPKLGLKTMLDFKVEVALEGQALTKEELLELSSANDGIVNIRGQWVEIDKEKLQQALDHWKDVQKHASDGQISFIDGMRLLAGAPTSLQEEQEDKEHSWVNISSGKTLKKLLKQLREPGTLPEETSLKNVKASLRPYQKNGICWLSLLSGLGLGSCLADDMGLGKTLQILSLLVIQKEKCSNPQNPPSLLVVPASLLGNWKREAKKFTPSLNLLFIHPSESNHNLLQDLTKSSKSFLKNIDLVITTYSMVTRIEWLSKTPWDLLILDEAQAIKNAGTKQSRKVKSLIARSRIALTGTPIENRLSDLWSLFDFLNPGLLGSSNRFKEYVKTLQNSPGQFESLRKLVSPYILRRMKTDPKIISDLPEKIETSSYCQLTKQQAKAYQSTVENLKTSLNTLEVKHRRGVVLQTLLNLKQICNHPAQFYGDGDYCPSKSGKFIRLKQICEELASRQEKVLIFSQFKEIIAPLEEHLTAIFGRKGLVLHGGTPIKKRKELVEEFQSDDGSPFFILSLKAGGTGLTLTAATHVIHFDRWWNPAVENQATDRAFRIGQKKNVQVHKFITMGTVEEQIDKIISSKKKLANEVLSNSDEIKITELSDNDLLELINLDINRATIT